MKALVLVALLLVATASRSESWSFGVIGDTPYSTEERRQLPRLLATAAAAGARFMLHAGDIKRGREVCDDALLADRQMLFAAAPLPLVLVPGDNEWTDCARVSAGRYDPLERLAQLRKRFWNADRTLGTPTLPLRRQLPDYPEHSRFVADGVMFIGLNVPGGDNGRGIAPRPAPEYLARSEAIRSWLREGFRLARDSGLSGVVILMQGDPGFASFARGIPRRGFGELLRGLRAEAETYPGQVLLIHGDGHSQRIDHPMRDRSGNILERFTRLETYGYPFLGWVRVTVNPRDPRLFGFRAIPSY